MIIYIAKKELIEVPLGNIKVDSIINKTGLIQSLCHNKLKTTINYDHKAVLTVMK